MSQSEKEGGRPRALRKILNFQCAVSDCQLIDLNFQGSKFTWNNKRWGQANVRERIDRALGNIKFREELPKAQVFHLEPIGSDHHMLLIDCCYEERKTPKQFKFEASWIKHPDFIEVVKRGWKMVEGVGNDKVFEIVRRLKSCSKALMKWSKIEFPNNRRLMDGLRSQLSACYEETLTEEVAGRIESLLKAIEEAWDKEEVY